MFVRRTCTWILKRNYHMKKLSIDSDKNPHVKKLVEEQLKRKQSKAVLDKLVEKR